MLCPTCQKDARRFGTNRNGTQRYQCTECRRTFTPRGPRPLGDQRSPKTLPNSRFSSFGCVASARAHGLNPHICIVTGRLFGPALANRFARLPAWNRLGTAHNSSLMAAGSNENRPVRVQLERGLQVTVMDKTSTKHR